MTRSGGTEPSRPPLSADVLVVGGGPAGWAVADQCANQGLRTVLIDPRPFGPWRATYGLWADQFDALPAGADVLPVRRLWAGGQLLDRGYAILDNESMLTAYRGSAVVAVADRVVSAHCSLHGVTVVRLISGHCVQSAVVIDASGRHRVLSGGKSHSRTEQTAYGVVVPADVAEQVVAAGDGVFMRWREHDCELPTFVYAMPLSDGRTLIEETSLARRPGVALSILESRLERRLAALGIGMDEVLAVERVRFPLDVPVPRRRRGVVAFGVAAGMMHPATGYSVGDALVTAPAVAAIIARTLPRGGVAAARAARSVVWSPAARLVHMLRLQGLRVLLTLPPARVPDFFEVFYGLPQHLQRAYVSGRGDVRGTVAAMSAMFRNAPAGLRIQIAVRLLGWH